MIDFMIRSALQLEGLSQEDIKALDDILPEIAALDKALIANWPAINKVVGTLLPIIQKVVAKQQETKT